MGRSFSQTKEKWQWCSIDWYGNRRCMWTIVCNILLLHVLIETSMSAVFDSQGWCQEMFCVVRLANFGVLWSRAEMEMCQCSSGCVQIPRMMIKGNHAISPRLVFQLIEPYAIKLTGFSVAPDEEHAACQHTVNMTDRTTKTLNVLMQTCKPWRIQVSV